MYCRCNFDKLRTKRQRHLMPFKTITKKIYLLLIFNILSRVHVTNMKSISWKKAFPT